jgi:hypothetical protein
MTPGFDDSTAPIADECQSLLDNVVAQFGADERRMIDRTESVSASGGFCCRSRAIGWARQLDRFILKAHRCHPLD